MVFLWLSQQPVVQFWWTFFFKICRAHWDLQNKKKIVKIDSGYLSLNKDLNGGFTKKSIVLLEYAPNIEIRYVILFLFNFIFNNMNAKKKQFIC